MLRNIVQCMFMAQDFASEHVRSQSLIGYHVTSDVLDARDRLSVSREITMTLYSLATLATLSLLEGRGVGVSRTPKH